MYKLNRSGVFRGCVSVALLLSIMTLAITDVSKSIGLTAIASSTAQVKDDYFYFTADGTRVSFQPRIKPTDLPVFAQDGLSTSKNTDNNNQSKLKEFDALSGEEKAILNKGKTVFSSEKGKGVLEILSKITVSLNNPENLDKLLKQFNLSIDRKLRLSGYVYSLNMNQNIYDEAQVFRMVRDINASGLVKWVEPQIKEKAKKTALTNDTLFSNQWYLHNEAKTGSLCDADCDATLGWDLAQGSGTVIAVIDDGVQLNHPDLNIWINTAEQANDGQDNDLNGYVDDIRGYDFVDDGVSCDNDPSYSGDGKVGQDNDPSPQAPSDCEFNGDGVVEDDHGTAVAGLAAAIGNNQEGISGVAHQAKILPIRLISDYDVSDANSLCVTAAEAIEYAGRYADVINNSWKLEVECAALNDAIANVTSGTQMAQGNGGAMVNVSKRPNLGSPVVFATGNDASGWYKVEIPNIRAGEHTFEWRFARDSAGFFEPNVKVWVDDIVWPGGTVENFESSTNLPNDFVTGCLNNACSTLCAPSNCSTTWEINQDGVHTRNGSNHSATVGDSTSLDSSCEYTYMGVKKEVPAGKLSFWVWFPEIRSAIGDRFEFLVDGQEQSAFFDFTRNVNDGVAYPANLPTTIAVGASTDGLYQDGANSMSSLLKEERVYYSQYAIPLDVFGAPINGRVGVDIVAPSSNQHRGVTTTDRTGDNGYHSAAQPDGVLSTNQKAYTSYFGGTSAAAPLVSGAIAAIISRSEVNQTRSAADIKGYLQQGADKIGPYNYVNGVSEEVGYGRLNVYQSIQRALGNNSNSIAETCAQSEPFSIDPSYVPIAKIDNIFESCPTIVDELKPTPDDDMCFPIVAKNGNAAIICL